MKDSSLDELELIVSSFDSLPMAEKVTTFSKLSPEGREELVSVISKPANLIRKISEEEMFFTIKQLGEEYAPNLLSLTTGKQLTYLLDIDLWKKDMFNQTAAARWMNILTGLGEDKILQFLQVTDPELLVTALNTFIQVTLRDSETDLLEQFDSLPPYTLDDLFFIYFKDPEVEEAVKNLLKVMFRWNTEFYFGLMEELSVGIHSENMVEANRWRQARLSEKGFPEFDEVLEIYSYIRKSELAPPDYENPSESEDAGGSFLGYPLMIISNDNLFRKSLDAITDSSLKDRIAEELSHLANKVMIADGLNPGAGSDLRNSLEKVGGYINIALEDLCLDDVSLAIGVLKSNHMEILFRRGFSLILDLRKEAQRLLRNYEGGIENLGYPLAGLVQGLMEPRPVYSNHLLGSGSKREFDKLEDIVCIKQMMEKTTLENKWEQI